VLESGNEIGEGLWVMSRDMPGRKVWRMLLCGERERIKDAAHQLTHSEMRDQVVLQLLRLRRGEIQREWRIAGWVVRRIPYSERERRSALTALTVLWGSTGRALGIALDPHVSHSRRGLAHDTLRRKRDQRAVRPLMEALLSRNTPEPWRCISTLGSLGDRTAGDALIGYMGFDSGLRDRHDYKVLPINDDELLDQGIEVGRALRRLDAQSAWRQVHPALNGDYSPKLRAAAALIAAGWGDPAHALSVQEMLGASEKFVKLAAITALGELRPESVMLLVPPFVSDPDPEISAAAEGAIQRAAARPRRLADKPRMYAGLPRLYNSDRASKAVSR